MARPKLKTEATSLKMSPEVRDLWERCAAQEHRSLTNMFEVMVRDFAKRLDVQTPPAPSSEATPTTATVPTRERAPATTKTTYKK